MQEMVSMCLDCGCGEPNEDHGNSAHITMRDVENAAKASEISVEEAVNNISRGMNEASQQAAVPQGSGA